MVKDMRTILCVTSADMRVTRTCNVDNYILISCKMTAANNVVVTVCVIPLRTVFCRVSGFASAPVYLAAATSLGR